MHIKIVKNHWFLQYFLFGDPRQLTFRTPSIFHKITRILWSNVHFCFCNTSCLVVTSTLLTHACGGGIVKKPLVCIANPRIRRGQHTSFYTDFIGIDDVHFLVLESENATKTNGFLTVYVLSSIVNDTTVDGGRNAKTSLFPRRATFFYIFTCGPREAIWTHMLAPLEASGGIRAARVSDPPPATQIWASEIRKTYKIQ